MRACVPGCLRLPRDRCDGGRHDGGSQVPGREPPAPCPRGPPAAAAAGRAREGEAAAAGDAGDAQEDEERRERPKKMIRARRSTIGTRVLVLPKAAPAPARAAEEEDDDDDDDDDEEEGDDAASAGTRPEARTGSTQKMPRRSSSQSLSVKSAPTTRLGAEDGQTDASSEMAHGSGGAEGIRSTKFFRFLRSFDPSRYEEVGFFDVLENLAEGDIVLFRTKRITSRIQRAFVKSGGFDHLGIVVLCHDCDDEKCCSPDLKQARAAAGVPPWHTLEADSAGVSVFRFTPHCLGAYKGIVAVRHLHLDKARFPPERVKSMSKTLNAFVSEMQGRPYEQNIFQMLRAANLFGHNQEEDLTSVFCSELVAAAYNRMGLLEAPHQRPSNAYIPGDFASKNAAQARAVKLVAGATLSREKILNSGNMRVKSPEPLPNSTASGPAPLHASADPPPGRAGSLSGSPQLSSSSTSSSTSPNSTSPYSSASLNASGRSITAAAIERKLLETLGPDAALDRPHVTRSPHGGSGLLSSSKRMVRLESESSTSIREPTEAKHDSRTLLPTAQPDRFRKIMVLERLKHEKVRSKRASFPRQSSVREGEAPIRIEDLNASAIVEELAKAELQSVPSAPMNAKVLTRDRKQISRRRPLPGDAIRPFGGVTDHEDMMDESKHRRDEQDDGATAGDIPVGEQSSHADRPYRDAKQTSTLAHGEKGRSRGSEISEGGAAQVGKEEGLVHEPTQWRAASPPRHSQSVRVARVLSRSDSASSLPSAGGRAWSDSMSVSDGYACNCVSEDLVLGEGATHLQYVCAAQAAWLNINFTIAPPSGPSFRGNECQGANVKVDLVVRGPLPSDAEALFGDDPVSYPQRGEDASEKGETLFSAEATASNDVILETPALHQPGWYELEWNNEGERDVQLTLLCYIQERDRASTLAHVDYSHSVVTET